MARKILLADDSVTAQNMGRRILSDAGYEVITVNNGSAALKKIAELTPDLIVLDVYMPGYGGLEVCQRLKESSATSRIPVLLTVGKLEPFKVEEARRVRADAHIVKPFDATELLAAIMRLEDKIVPQAAPSKPARSSRTETSSSRKGRDKSIDPASETSIGWRKRLSIPKIASRSEDAAEDRPKPDTTGFQDFARGKEEKPLESKTAETAVAAPQEKSSDEQSPNPARPFENFTVERLMAIEASAPAIEAAPPAPEEIKKNLESAIAEGSKGVSDSSDVTIVESTSTADAIKSEIAELNPATSSETGLPDVVAESETPASEKPAEDSISSAAIATKAVSEPAIEAKAAVRSEDSPSEDEVMAALASLSPADEVAKTEPATALAGALAAVSSVFTGPRWIAESVALSDGDSHLILESEMEKVYAAFAAADAAAAYARSTEPSVGAVADIFADVATQNETPIASITVEVSSEMASESHAAVAQNSDSQPIVADAFAESSAEVEIAASAADQEVSAVSTEFADLRRQASEVAGEDVGFREIAFAAAAASAGARTVESRSASNLSAIEGSSISESLSSDPNAAATLDVEPAAAPEEIAESSVVEVPAAGEVSPTVEGNKERESQLAAAWQNWRQIRESIAGPQLTSQIADAAAEGFKQIRGEKNPDEETTSHQAAADASIIAGIVDSVFAELKPKLMEEIARKLAQERR